MDALVFSGGIGQNSASTRGLMCRGLERLGLSLDQRKNNLNGGRVAATASIGSEGSSIEVVVVPADEELCIARQVETLLSPAAD